MLVFGRRLACVSTILNRRRHRCSAQLAICDTSSDTLPHTQVVFAYTSLGSYDQELFDAAAKEITRKATDATPQAASQVGLALCVFRWCAFLTITLFCLYFLIPPTDPNYAGCLVLFASERAGHPAPCGERQAPVVYLGRGECRRWLKQNEFVCAETEMQDHTRECTHPSIHSSHCLDQLFLITLIALHLCTQVMQEHIEKARAPTSPQLPDPQLLQTNETLSIKNLLTFLLAYANVSHHAPKLFTESGLLLASRISSCSPQVELCPLFFY